MKTSTFIILFFLTSCSVIKNYKLDYMKNKYERQYNFCIDFMNNKIKYDSLTNDSNIVDTREFKKYKKRQWFDNLDIYMYTKDYILVEFDKYIVSNYSSGIPPVNSNQIDIVFTIFNKEHVICFEFKEINNKYKLLNIRANPGRYHKHRRPKRAEPTGHGAHYNY